MKHVIDGVDTALAAVHLVEQALPLAQKHALCLARTALFAGTLGTLHALGVAGAVAEAPFDIGT